MRGTSVVSNISVTAAKLNFVLEGMAGCISALSHKDKLMAQAITLSPDPAPVRTNNPRVNKLIENNKPAYVSVKRPCPALPWKGMKIPLFGKTLEEYPRRKWILWPGGKLIYLG